MAAKNEKTQMVKINKDDMPGIPHMFQEMADCLEEMERKRLQKLCRPTPLAVKYNEQPAIAGCTPGTEIENQNIGPQLKSTNSPKSLGSEQSSAQKNLLTQKMKTFILDNPNAFKGKGLELKNQPLSKGSEVGRLGQNFPKPPLQGLSGQGQPFQPNVFKKYLPSSWFTKPEKPKNMEPIGEYGIQKEHHNLEKSIVKKN